MTYVRVDEGWYRYISARSYVAKATTYQIDPDLVAQTFRTPLTFVRPQMVTQDFEEKNTEKMYK